MALVIGSAVCFGSLGVFGKLAYRMGLTTPQLLSYRFAFAAVLMWLVAFAMGERVSRRSLLGLIIMGGAGYVGQSGAYFNALHYIPASTTAKSRPPFSFRSKTRVTRTPHGPTMERPGSRNRVRGSPATRGTTRSARAWGSGEWPWR